jgi:cell division protein FtsB
MLLDVGAKTSNLLFFEKGKVYSRSINIGANSITHDFANETKMKFAEAEAVKLDKGSVSLGGAYEEPEDPQAAAIAKIARQVMTRLHIQVNQTIQFFRGQQGGSAPQRLFLSGGASIMPYTAQFFAEKLNLPVDYFNPFRNIEIDPSLDLEQLSKHAHSFGEVVGLGLRDLAHCPVELNLMPKSSIQRQEFAHKKPYLVASIFSLALVVFAIYLAERRIGEALRKKVEDTKQPLAQLTAQSQQLQSALNDREQLKKQADQMKELADTRFYWSRVLTELRRVLMQAEASEKAALRTPENGGTNTDVGVWVENFNPEVPNGSPFAAGVEGGSAGFSAPGGFGYGRMDPRMRGYGGFGRPQQGPTGPPRVVPGMAVVVGANEIAKINLTCRAVNRQNLSPMANEHLAFAVQRELNKSPSFKEATFSQQAELTMDGNNTNTFTFSITVTLAKPFKL